MLQSRLEALGFELGPVDGDFGMKTLAAVKSFQTSKGLTTDGVVGPQTARALGLDTQASSGQSASPRPATTQTSPNVLGTPRWLEIAQNEVGQKEISGNNHNSRIIAYHASTSLKAKQDEVAWCASFVNWCLTQAGIKGTNSAAAASWASWGSACNARHGAIAVIYNAKAANSSLSTSGNHVGFLVDETNTHYKLLGGNQGDQVKVSSFPKSKWKLKGYRWPNGVGEVSSASKQPSAGSGKPVQSKPAIATQYKSAAESLVRPFVTSYGLGLGSMDEEGVAKALHGRGKDVHLVTAVFKLLDEKYNSDSDDVAILYLELVKSRGGAALEMLKKETALRKLLIQILSTDVVTPEDSQAVRYLKGLAGQGAASKPAGSSPPPPVNKTESTAIIDGVPLFKQGDKGTLVEEINLRLMGFGGTATAGKAFDEFTAKTEAAVKRFQQDYMGVAGTGKVCGAVLSALDEFRTKHPVNFSAMLCTCGHCKGFGNGNKTSQKSGVKNKAGTGWVNGIEYPGIHRALIWSFRASLFYTSVKDAALGYRFLKISSGYRCWMDNKAHGRRTTNHMGNALDLQFRKGAVQTRCQGADVDNLRSKVFIARMGAQLSWTNKNKLSLEPASAGATSWVHMDVREFEDGLKADRYYATSQAMADGSPLMDLAKKGNLKLVNGAGSAGSPPARRAAEEKTNRLPVSSLKLSKAGIDFIKGWEKFGEMPYDDSEGYCTVGWGHLLAKKSCAALKAAKDPEYEMYKNGVSEEEAEIILKKDIRRITDKAALTIHVPLYQHEYDALMSLAFNAGGLSKFPKLISKLNSKDYNGCCDEFADITNGGTKGLVLRRKAEMKIFRDKVYDSTH